MLRIDTAEHFFGLRLNVFTAAVVGLLAVAYLVWQRGRPREVITRGATKDTVPATHGDQRAGEAVGRAARDVGEPPGNSGRPVPDQRECPGRQPAGDS